MRRPDARRNSAHGPRGCRQTYWVARPPSCGGTARRRGRARSAAAGARRRAGRRRRARPSRERRAPRRARREHQIGQPDRVAEQLARRRAAELGPRPVEPCDHARGRERVPQLAHEPATARTRRASSPSGWLPFARRDPALEAAQVDAQQLGEVALRTSTAAASQRASSLGCGRRRPPRPRRAPRGRGSAARARPQRVARVPVDRGLGIEHRAMDQQREVGVGRGPALERRRPYRGAERGDPRRRPPPDTRASPPAGRSRRRPPQRRAAGCARSSTSVVAMTSVYVMMTTGVPRVPPSATRPRRPRRTDGDQDRERGVEGRSADGHRSFTKRASGSS